MRHIPFFTWFFRESAVVFGDALPRRDGDECRIVLVARVRSARFPFPLLAGRLIAIREFRAARIASRSQALTGTGIKEHRGNGDEIRLCMKRGVVAQIVAQNPVAVPLVLAEHMRDIATVDREVAGRYVALALRCFAEQRRGPGSCRIRCVEGNGNSAP
ncbi:hypothetical protein [Paraburkholderia hospita]|uniref:hypothetical protein n=1 Tax=Paraburkholderia hospita TaxID=169430 RepID=UPI001FC9A65E|nr:hypothetical protein [Paraburkholderia hospita]